MWNSYVVDLSKLIDPVWCKMGVCGGGVMGVWMGARTRWKIMILLFFVMKMAYLVITTNFEIAQHAESTLS